MNEQITIHPALQRLAALLPGDVYLVGGAVRNALLGMEPADLDICGALTAEAVEAAALGAGLRCHAKNKALGTVGITVEGQTVEYTQFRRESYARGGAHRPATVQLGATMEEDALRRDFTVNAMYARVSDGRIFDPLNGRADLAAGLLRSTRPETLLEDALRVLRLVRFAGELGFDIEQNTFETAKSFSPHLTDIAPERIREELLKIILCDVRYPSLPQGAGRDVVRALQLLEDLGAMAVILPELSAGKDLPQRADYHKYRVEDHCFHVCAAAEPNMIDRLAGLLHDIAKPEVYNESGKYLFHDLRGEQRVRQRLGALRFPNREIEEVAFLTRWHMYGLGNDTKDRTLRDRFAHWGRPRTEALIRLREADIRGSGLRTDYREDRWRALLADMIEENAPFSPEELCLGGRELMEITGIRPGPGLGKLKEALWKVCIQNPKLNTPEELSRRAQHLARDLGIVRTFQKPDGF